MRKIFIRAAFIVLCAAPASAAEKATRFWNLASATVTDFRLSPAGADAFGENLCLRDKDGEVEHDERLKIADVAAGAYDAKIALSDGRVCIVENLSIETGKVFSIEDKDLVACSK
jgi:hypothetical protein